ncbi:MAG: hypothetical protein K2P86_08025 [Xanthobacteraceae bacterium]|nr:hypothetical protein [Xanthobacteraceae bacterium]
MKVEKETLQELHKLILEQTNDLWLIAAGLIAFQALVIAHIIYSPRRKDDRSIVVLLLSASTVLHVLSLTFGYFAKGVLVQSMISYVNGKEWVYDPYTGLMSLLQLIFVTGGLLVFVVAFVMYSRVLAKAVVAGAGK